MSVESECKSGATVILGVCIVRKHHTYTIGVCLTDFFEWWARVGQLYQTDRNSQQYVAVYNPFIGEIMIKKVILSDLHDENRQVIHWNKKT